MPNPIVTHHSFPSTTFHPGHRQLTSHHGTYTIQTPRPGSIVRIVSSLTAHNDRVGQVQQLHFSAPLGDGDKLVVLVGMVWKDNRWQHGPETFLSLVHCTQVRTQGELMINADPHKVAEEALGKSLKDRLTTRPTVEPTPTVEPESATVPESVPSPEPVPPPKKKKGLF